MRPVLFPIFYSSPSFTITESFGMMQALYSCDSLPEDRRGKQPAFCFFFFSSMFGFVIFWGSFLA
jgi:hypothetical protein